MDKRVNKHTTVSPNYIRVIRLIRVISVLRVIRVIRVLRVLRVFRTLAISKPNTHFEKNHHASLLPHLVHKRSTGQ